MKSDVEALIITASGVLCHIYRIYPIGAKGDEWLDCYQANFTSVCFVVGVSLLLSLRDLWPAALKPPPQPVLCVYLGLMSAFFTSLSLRMIWLPLTMSITQSNVWMAYKLKTWKSIKGPLVSKLIDVLESQILQNLEITFLAVFFLVYALKASGIYKGTNTAGMYTKPGQFNAEMLKKARSSFPRNVCRKFIPEAFEENIAAEEDILRDGSNFFSEMVCNGGFRDVINDFVSTNM